MPGLVPRVFWFDDHKTPNAADALEKRDDVALLRLAFDAAYGVSYYHRSRGYCG